jgi:hypothetical protein
VKIGTSENLTAGLCHGNPLLNLADSTTVCDTVVSVS